jgi:transposase-like protein
MSDADAYAAFRAVRFEESGGEPVCPGCDCDATYEFKARRLFKCKGCEKQFTLTSGTIFASRKMSLRDILTAIALFVNGANGHSALRLSRDLNCSYKTAYVLLHKLRDLMADIQAAHTLTGVVEIDGIYFGGHVRAENMKIDRKDRRKQYNEKRRAIVTIRERRRGGRSRAVVVKQERDAVATINAVVHPSSDLVTDQGTSWGKLFLPFNDHKTVNHSIGHMIDGIHINGVEGQNSRIRRAETGVYLQINSRHAQAYADELSWRDDHRRVSNGQQFQTVLSQAGRLRSQKGWWLGYWNKRPRPEGATSVA